MGLVANEEQAFVRYFCIASASQSLLEPAATGQVRGVITAGIYQYAVTFREKAG